MRLWMIAPLGLALLTAACGTNDEQRAASGGLGGAAAGALVGGPVGAVVGGAAGATGGALRDDAERKIDEAHADDSASSRQTAQTTQTTQTTGTGSGLTNREVRNAQEALRDMGLYDGQIDGLYGPRTQMAVERYQQRQGLPITAALDDRTRSSLRQQSASRPQQEGMEQRGMEQEEQDQMNRTPMQPRDPTPTGRDTVQ